MMLTTFDRIAPIPEGLLDFLRQAFPDRAPRPGELDPTRQAVTAGQHQVIDHIEALYRQQNDRE